MGIQYLHRQLTEHIQEKLPSLQDKLSKRMVLAKKHVEDFKNLHSDDPEIMKTVILKLVFTNEFKCDDKYERFHFVFIEFFEKY